ncbi:MAG: ABC transporter permease [Oscillospiraceae bacterium]|jgi:ribose transport system permease protein|nr:ABC transporter permease [Oscillospiraceae bacterium]
MRRQQRVKLGDAVPFIAFVVIFLFFAVASRGKMFSSYNLMLLVDQSMVTILLGCGMLFVVAQGSIDLSVGVNLALSGVAATYAANIAGAWAFIPTAMLVGAIVGVFNGVVVSKGKVSSFMLTISMLIGVRGIVNFIQESLMKTTGNGSQKLPDSLLPLGSNTLRAPVFIVIVLVMAYLFEFTKLGRYGKAIGENERSAGNVGVPVTLMKILAFGISGLLAGVGGVFTVSKYGATNQTMGQFMEMQVAMAIFLGGVLVTGGAGAKIYKVVLGSLSITLIVNGLAIIGKSDSDISQTVEGILLLAILFITILVNSRATRRRASRKATVDGISGADSADAELAGFRIDKGENET